MLQTFTFSGARMIHARGTFARYEAGTAGGADETIRLRADGQDLGLYRPGDSIELPMPASVWELQPVTPTTSGELRIGMGRVQSARLVGNVRVIDVGSEKTAVGQQFLGSGAAGPFSTNGCMVGLRSLSRQVNVKSISASSTNAGEVLLWSCTGDPTANQSITAGFAVNKLIGAPASSARRITGTTAGIDPTVGELPGANPITSVWVPANQTTPVPITTPIVLPAGAGLVVHCRALNRNVAVLLDFEEQ